MVVTDDEYIQMHMSASCLHYGIELFEGLKAFRGVTEKCDFSALPTMRGVSSLGETLVLAGSFD